MGGIIAVSVYSIIIYEMFQVLILRIPIHEVASLSYINDDQEHLLFLKAGKTLENLTVEL